MTARPSLHAVMMKRKAELEHDEAQTADALAAQGKLAGSQLARFVPARQAAVVDAAYDRLRYKEGGKEPPTEKFARTERDLLVLRGRTGEPPRPLTVGPAVDAPERGHRTFRLGVGGGVGRGVDGTIAGFQQLTVRLAIHDHLDAPRGYVGDAVLEMGNLALRFADDCHTVSVERADFLRIVSPAPLDSWAPKLSWGVRVGGEQQHWLGCAGWSCLATGVSAGAGLATKIGRPFLLYGLAEGDVAGGGVLAGGYHGGVGGSAVAVLRLGNACHTQLGGRYIYYLVGDRRRALVATLGQAVNLGSRAQLRAIGDLAGKYREARLEAVAYF